MVDYQKEPRYASFLAAIIKRQNASFLARLKGNYPSFWHSFRQRPCPPCGKTQSANRLNHHIDWPLVEHHIRDYQVPISPLVIQTPLELHLNSRKQVNLEKDQSSISCSLIFILKLSKLVRRVYRSLVRGKNHLPRDNDSFPPHSIPKTESLYYDQYLVQLILLVNPGFYSRICYFHTSKALSRPNAWTQSA